MGSVAVVAMGIHKKFSKAVMMDCDCGVIGERVVYHDDRGWVVDPPNQSVSRGHNTMAVN